MGQTYVNWFTHGSSDPAADDPNDGQRSGSSHLGLLVDRGGGTCLRYTPDFGDFEPHSCPVRLGREICTVLGWDSSHNRDPDGHVPTVVTPLLESYLPQVKCRLRPPPRFPEVGGRDGGMGSVSSDICGDLDDGGDGLALLLARLDADDERRQKNEDADLRFDVEEELTLPSSRVGFMAGWFAARIRVSDLRNCCLRCVRRASGRAKVEV